MMAVGVCPGGGGCQPGPAPSRRGAVVREEAISMGTPSQVRPRAQGRLFLLKFLPLAEEEHATHLGAKRGRPDGSPFRSPALRAAADASVSRTGWRVGRWTPGRLAPPPVPTARSPLVRAADVLLDDAVHHRRPRVYSFHAPRRAGPRPRPTRSPSRVTAWSWSFSAESWRVRGSATTSWLPFHHGGTTFSPQRRIGSSNTPPRRPSKPCRRSIRRRFPKPSEPPDRRETAISTTIVMATARPADLAAHGQAVAARGRRALRR